MAKYPYIVNNNGVWYPAGAEVPAKPTFQKESHETRNVAKTTPYTKTEISRMTTSELKKVANDMNIENAETMTGVEIKKCLYKMLEL